MRCFWLLNLQTTLLWMVPVVRNLEVLLVCTAGLTVPTTQKPKTIFLCVDQVVNYAPIFLLQSSSLWIVISISWAVFSISSSVATPHFPSHPTPVLETCTSYQRIITLIFQWSSPSLRSFHPKDGTSLGTPLAELLVSSNYKDDMDHQASKLLFVRNREFPVYVHADFK
jgi:hypothetical protein